MPAADRDVAELVGESSHRLRGRQAGGHGDTPLLPVGARPGAGRVLRADDGVTAAPGQGGERPGRPVMVPGSETGRTRQRRGGGRASGGGLPAGGATPPAPE